MAETPATTKKVTRSKQMAFLNTGTSSSPTWSRMGKGIASQTINYNPQTESECYIDEDSASTGVDSYQPTIPTTQSVYDGEPCFAFVNNLRRKRAVGGDAETEILLVDAFGGSSGSYPAERNACSIQIDSYGGEGGKALGITYTVNLIGDAVTGTFNPSTKTFTASGS